MSVRSRMSALAALVVVAATALAGCGANNDPLAGDSAAPSAGGAGGEVVVGSANFTENQVLAELYAQAMTAKGVKASTHLDIGSRELYLRALKDGSISVVPEYTGNLLQYLDKKATASTPEEVDEQLPKAAKDSGFDVLDTTEAVDQDVYVVTKALADKYQLKTLGDLTKVPDLKVGGPTELQERPYGPDGLQGMYKVKVSKFVAYDAPALKVKDLKDGKIQAADFFTTDAAIADNGFVKLEDPQTLILPQNVVPLVRPDVKKNSKAVDAMNAVGKQLTTDELAALNKKVDVDHADPGDVAKEWLTSKGLV
ncbi:ABC transporter substrate-binding protein [Microlunatus soli]|uniref:Osmoprotectant transport system substrate-binding protein n=1 Tax=Microlunatus soli TaxID=630515 RepID=A0A1H1VHF7_9ACTN|nr:ABC transporter substrate-binding protein [Microlunatus soli]SDS84000.1 osmoprotectant transport system substrate-binding protein [Microlunatus soli]